MEPERERLRPRASKQSQEEVSETMPPEFRKDPEDRIRFDTIKKNYSRETSVVLGFSFMTVGLVGFVIPYFLSLHLSYIHNALHVVTGALALWFGFYSENAAKKFNYIAGAFYVVLGLLGFVAGIPGIATVANPIEDRFLWKIMPEALELGTSDHIFHLAVGAVFIVAAALQFKIKVSRENP